MGGGERACRAPPRSAVSARCRVRAQAALLETSGREQRSKKPRRGFGARRAPACGKRMSAAPPLGRHKARAPSGARAPRRAASGRIRAGVKRGSAPRGLAWPPWRGRARAPRRGRAVGARWRAQCASFWSLRRPSLRSPWVCCSGARLTRRTACWERYVPQSMADTPRCPQGRQGPAAVLAPRGKVRQIRAHPWTSLRPPGVVDPCGSSSTHSAAGTCTTHGRSGERHLALRQKESSACDVA